MKVLVVSENIFPPAVDIAGMSIIYKIQKRLKRENIDIHVLTTIRSWAAPGYKHWFKTQEKKYGLHFHYVDVGFIDRYLLLYLFISKLLIFFKVIQLNSKYSYDIIHDYSSSPLLFFFTGVYKRLFNKTVFHTLCAYFNSILGSFTLMPSVSSIDKIIYTSVEIEKKIIEKIENKDKIMYIPLGVDSIRFQEYRDTSHIMKNLKLLSNEKIVLFLGPLEKRKGVFILAKAIELVIQEQPNTIFIFATYGSGGVDKDHKKHREELLNLCRKNEKSIRIIEGKHDVPLLMKLSDIFVLPLTSLHGTLVPPLTLLEGMSAGKPCIVSDLKTFDELVEDERTALKFPNGDYKTLSKKIITLLSSEKLRNEIGFNAKERILMHYDVEYTVQKLKNLYDTFYFHNKIKQKIIAFIGVDGSGKTTLSKSITNIIIRQNISAIRISPFKYIFLNHFLKYIKKTESNKTIDNLFLKESRKPFVYKLWPLLALLDNWIYYILKIRPLVRIGHTIICDRYFYDFAISFDYFGYSSNIINELYLSMMPLPDITILLDIDPRIAKKREIGDEHNLHFFIKQRERYLKLALNRKFIIINVDKEIAEILTKIVKVLCISRGQNIEKGES